MAIKIEVRAAGLNLSASLKDEALAALITLIQQQRDETPPSQTSVAIPVPRSNEHASEESASLIQDSLQDVKEWMASHGGAELLNMFKWDSYPEKILLLSAWHEAKGGHSPWRSSDMDEVFKQAKEKPPANFPRDIRNAIKNGLIHAETPRTYTVTRTGWNKVCQRIEEMGL